MKNWFKTSLALTLAMACATSSALACTGAYVGQDVSEDGSIIIARSEDIGPSDYNKLHTVIEASSEAGRVMTDINGFALPLPDTTFRYTSMLDYSTAGDGVYNALCTNEMGVTITGTVSASPCTEFKEADPYVSDGLREAVLPGAIAATASTAREGVEILCAILDNYGAAQGNIIMIADQTEAWYVEIYGGHEYAAMKMPTDAVAVYGNQYMIGAVDPADTDTYIFSENLFTKLDEAGLTVVDEDGYVLLAQSMSNQSRSASSNMRTWGGHVLLAPSSVDEVYDNDTFYPLFYTPDETVSVFDVMEVYSLRYQGMTEDMTLEGNESNRAIGVSTTPETHIVQIFPDNSLETSTVSWLAMGGGENGVFIPELSAAVTEVHPAMDLDAPEYDSDSAYWTFKSVSAVADSNREVYADGVQAYWSVQEQLMYNQIMDSMDEVDAAYAVSTQAGQAYVNQLTYDMTQNTLDDASAIFDKLFQLFIRNTGKSYGSTLEVFSAQTALGDLAELHGYAIAWDAATETATMTDGTNTVVVTIGSDVAIINDVEVALDADTCYYNNRTYVATTLSDLL